jgi:virulence-associated protein VagC
MTDDDNSEKNLPEPSVPRRGSWDAFFNLLSTCDIPEDFMANREDSPPQERKLF